MMHNALTAVELVLCEYYTGACCNSRVLSCSSCSIVLSQRWSVAWLAVIYCGNEVLLLQQLLQMSAISFTSIAARALYLQEYRQRVQLCSVLFAIARWHTELLHWFNSNAVCWPCGITHNLRLLAWR
jgi:hypothetical protein